MKRFADLTPSDIERVAVWRYEGASDDDAIVRATAREALSEGDGDTFIARTQFHLANGAQHLGFCSPIVGETALEILQPVIVTAEGLVFFYFEGPPSHETLDRQWRRLGMEREQLFPIHYRCLVPVDGRYITGTIEADDLTGAA